MHIINAARGGVVDEVALYEALKTGRIAGLGIDVYSTEPCSDSPLFGLDNVVATPHLGASTEEAQERAGIAVAVSVRKALAGELVPDAVNVRGGTIDKDVRPALPLVETLGQIISGLAGGAPSTVVVEVRGEIANFDCEILATSALKGLLLGVVGDGVSYVNAPMLAKERGLVASVIKNVESEDHRNAITLTAALGDGTQISVSGTLAGLKRVQKIVAIDDLALDLIPSESLLFLRYADKPGVIGVVGRILGEASINIGGMQVARDRAGGEALMVLTIDSAVGPELAATISTETKARVVRFVNLL